jgi:hypothetical protein
MIEFSITEYCTLVIDYSVFLNPLIICSDLLKQIVPHLQTSYGKKPVSFIFGQYKVRTPKFRLAMH